MSDLRYPGRCHESTLSDMIRGMLTTSMQRMSRVILLSLVLLALLVPTGARGQTPDLRLSGSVLDAETMEPLGHAYVRLLRLGEPAAMPLTASANGYGQYVFAGLLPGRYELRASRIGYAEGAVQIRLERTAASELLSIGLTVEPIILEPVASTPTREVATFDLTVPPDVSAAVQLELIRQQRFLEGDVRLMSSEQTRETQTLGEPDLLRAFERLPGVSTRDDYTTELWIRGASWSRAAVSFDGIPLFSPLHAGGAVSAISSDIVGNASMHPGVQAAGPLNGTAGSVVVESRLPQDEGAALEVTTMRAGIAAEGTLGERGGWIVAMRRSHLDLLPRGLAVLNRSSARVPYHFHDVAGRASFDLAPDWALEVSGLFVEDRLNGEIDGLISAQDATRGSSAFRASVVARMAGEVRATVGHSRLGIEAASSDELWDPASDGPVVLPGLDNAVRARFAELTWRSTPGTRAGVRLTRLDARSWTDGMWPYRDGEAPFTMSSRLDYATTWVQHRFLVSERLSIEPGLTIEAGSGVHLSPRASARYLATPRTALSVGAGRSYQHARPLSPAGPGLHRVAFGDLFWVIADTTPALRADVATLGVEHWAGDAALFSATAYARAATDVSTSSVQGGALRDNPLLPLTDERAHGLELSLRKLSGAWTGSVGYAWNDSELTTRDSAGSFDAPFERRHTFDVQLGLQLPGGLNARLDYVIASGAPYTQYLAPGAYCTSPTECEHYTPDGEGPTDPGGAFEPSAQRSDWYRSLGLGVRWQSRVRGVDTELFAQMHNVLGRSNPAAYRFSARYLPGCEAGPQACTERARDVIDQALPGLSRVPSLGFRAWF